METEIPSATGDNTTRAKDLLSTNDQEKPPCNYQDAVKREDQRKMAETYINEHQGLIEQGMLKIVQKKGQKCWTTPLELITK
jgi:hypothetical protein